MRDLINICLENESQDYGMTFNMIVIAQSTLISYHTEVFVKTEVGCTVVGSPFIGTGMVPYFSNHHHKPGTSIHLARNALNLYAIREVR